MENQIMLELRDEEWQLDYIDHDRMIARAIVFDDEGYLYFVRAERDDLFGKAALIETSGAASRTARRLRMQFCASLMRSLA